MRLEVGPKCPPQLAVGFLPILALSHIWLYEQTYECLGSRLM
jgi:hypothetical protein